MDELTLTLIIVIPMLLILMIVFITKAVQSYNENQKKIKRDFALKNGLEFDDSLEKEISTDFQFLANSKWGKFSNFFKKDNMILFEYTVSTGKSQIVYTIMQYKLKNDVPQFTLNIQNIFHNIGKMFGYQDIDFPHAPKFSKKYLLRGSDENRIKAFFTQEKTKFFEDLEDFDNIEVNNNVFMTYRYKIVLDDYIEFIDNNRKIIEILES